ncbi:C-C motif chemokine 14 [Enhydra lutris kenyoni]|uniref:C-C motif chemokine 14 n=1 Tax=Enhydra lutris kenyoni TaxID=391180 RepID=A0A2Y9JWJ0_ENHLU|nr:C-C motif chemokine 14 [Enhydra lutris kenyoni]
MIISQHLLSPEASKVPTRSALPLQQLPNKRIKVSTARRMKVSMAATSLFLILLITCALGRKPEQSSRGPYHPAECCVSYIAQAITRHRITDYYETSSQCSKPGVVFITKKGHSVCANPRDDWVQNYIKDLEEKRVTRK